MKGPLAWSTTAISLWLSLLPFLLCCNHVVLTTAAIPFVSSSSNNIIAYSEPVRIDKERNISLLWSGGRTASPCTCSLAPPSYFVHSFACNENRFPWAPNSSAGDWMEGKKPFKLVVPASELVVQINVTLVGRFKCSDPLDGGGNKPKPTIFTVAVNGFFIQQETQNVEACGLCDYCGQCDHCVVTYNITGSIFSSGFDDWKYGDAENLFQLSVDQGYVCLHAAHVIVGSVPRSSPVVTSSGTSGSSSGGVDDIPLWAILLLGGVGSFCLLSVVCVFSLITLTRWRNHRQLRREVEALHINYPFAAAEEEGKKSGGLLAGIFGSKEEKRALLRNKRKKRLTRTKQMDFDEIKIDERIGKGSYGEVYRGTWRGTVVAIKKLPYYLREMENSKERFNFMQSFVEETNIMKSLSHPNIVQLYASFTQPEVCMVMEYMSRGSLYQILHNDELELSWDLLRQIMLDACKGMTYLHNSEPVIVHRDLKSHNLLVSESWQTKVADFGLSRIVDVGVTQAMTACGTPSWTAPEVLRGEKYTTKCDVYSFGVVLWECVTRQNPYGNMPHFQIVFQVGTQGLRPQIPKTTPHAWARLIADCWSEDPDKRPTFEETMHRLERF
ncbi:putative Serine/threonine protein kinase-transforming protein Rmil [Balamuthia mandrillaris]